MRMLPIVKLGDTLYFMDARLKEFRNVEQPMDKKTFDEFLDSVVHDINLEFGLSNDEESIKGGKINYLELKFNKGLVD